VVNHFLTRLLHPLVVRDRARKPHGYFVPVGHLPDFLAHHEVLLEATAWVARNSSTCASCTSSSSSSSSSSSLGSVLLYTTYVYRSAWLSRVKVTTRHRTTAPVQYG
jgi:hypothetical protein